MGYTNRRKDVAPPGLPLGRPPAGRSTVQGNMGDYLKRHLEAIPSLLYLVYYNIGTYSSIPVHIDPMVSDVSNQRRPPTMTPGGGE